MPASLLCPQATSCRLYPVTDPRISALPTEAPPAPGISLLTGTISPDSWFSSSGPALRLWPATASYFSPPRMSLQLSVVHRDHGPYLVSQPPCSVSTHHLHRQVPPFPCSYVSHTECPPTPPPPVIFLEKSRGKGSVPQTGCLNPPSPLRAWPPFSVWRTSTHPSKPQLRCPLSSLVPMAAPSLAGGAGPAPFSSSSPSAPEAASALPTMTIRFGFRGLEDVLNPCCLEGLRDSARGILQGPLTGVEAETRPGSGSL